MKHVHVHVYTGDTLEGGGSKATFSHNVETEMNAGKPQKQALAIAYSEKNKDGCDCNKDASDFLTADLLKGRRDLKHLRKRFKTFQSHK